MLDNSQTFIAPNKNYEKFFAKFKEIETLPIKDWCPPHIIAYFCAKYKLYFKKDYTFKFNSQTAGKSFEIFIIKKISILMSSSPEIIRDYIDWIFKEKIIKQRKNIRSISFLAREENLQEYKLNILLNNGRNNNIDRSTLLPDKYKEIFSLLNLSINTYGDLAFIYKMENMPNEYITAFDKLEELGFDNLMLDRVI